MKPVHSLMIIILCLSLLSCKKDTGEKHNRMVNLKTSIESGITVKSPALDNNGSGNFTNGDTFTLYVSQNGTELNVFDYTVGSTELFWNEIKANGNKVTFSAFYPKQVSPADGKFTFDLSQETDKDLLMAVKTDITPDTEDIIDLKFRHAMHKLNITFKTEESDIDLDNIQTICTAKSACEINMSDAGIKTLDKTTEFEANGKEISFMLVPQTTSGVSLKIKAGNIEKTLTVNDIKPDLDNLESGMQLNIELTIKNGKIEIGNTSIQGWGDQGTVEGEIII